MRFISWFSGVGGFDLALARAGHECVGACEIDRFARRVYERRFLRPVGVGARSPHWFPKDIRRVKPREIPEADLWCAGSPCQGFSVAGRRGGLDDPRSGLLRRWVGLVGEVRPRWLLLENVPGILSVGGGRDWAEFVAAVCDMGYRLAWRVLDARWFGVPQRRRRVFALGCLGDDGSPEEVLLEPEGRAGDPAAGGEAGAGAPGGAYVGALGAGGRAYGADEAAAGQLVCGTLRSGGNTKASHRKRNGSDAPELLIAGCLMGSKAGSTGVNRDTTFIVNAAKSTARKSHAREASHARCLDRTGGFAANQGGTVIVNRSRYFEKDGEVTEGYNLSDTANALHTASGNKESLVLVGALLGSYGTGSEQHPERVGRDGQLVAQPVRSNPYNNSDPGMEAKMHVAVGGTVRRLTPLECERLQGFPDGWTCLCMKAAEHGAVYALGRIGQYVTSLCKCPDSARYRALGNAVAVPVVEWIGRRLALVAAEGTKSP